MTGRGRGTGAGWGGPEPLELQTSTKRRMCISDYHIPVFTFWFGSLDCRHCPTETFYDTEPFSADGINVPRGSI